MNTRPSHRHRARPTHWNRTLIGLLVASLVLVSGCAGSQQGEEAQTQESASAASQETVVLVVRHAERDSQAPNSDLAGDPGGTGVGLGRAEALADVAEDAGVGAIYTTDLCRTAQTGQPAAARLGLSLGIMVSGSQAAGLGSCTPAIAVPTSAVPAASAAEVAAHIKEAHAGMTVLVVGHSNTVPQLVEALGVPPLCPALFPPDDRYGCLLPEDDNQHLFIVRLPSAGPATMEHQVFGATG